MTSRHPSRTTLTAIASIVGGVYLLLVVAALFCATAHASHHEHTGSHSPLCAWACQANNSVAFVSVEAATLPTLLTIATLAFLYHPPVAIRRIRLSPRAPPIL